MAVTMEATTAMITFLGPCLAFDTYPQLPSTKSPLALVGGPGPGQRVEVNKIASEVVPHSIAVEFQYSWTRMTRNFPSNLASQKHVLHRSSALT